MKIYSTQEEVEKDIKNRVLAIEGDVDFQCSISISASIIVTAGNINAWNINAWNINARDINAWNINARDINAWDINARNINAWNINAWDISFYAICSAYAKFICKSIIGHRENSRYFSLDGEVEIIKPKE